MDKNAIGGLINSISRLVHLIACQTMKRSDLKCIRYIVRVLKLVKPVLDEALDTEIPSDEQLIGTLEELDTAVNRSREFVEKPSHKMSKIYSVLLTEPMAQKVRESSIEICYLLKKSLQSFSKASRSATIQHCLQELQCGEETSELINIGLKHQKENIALSPNDVIKIIETLGLASTQELLTENIALEKERMRTEHDKNTENANRISEIIALVTQIRYCMAKFEQFGFVNGVPIPSHFRCALSLELMLDPVIVASGQTYERSFIQKWLDNGLGICPKTRQTLSHTNLIPNLTVKAMIANWCEENNISLCDYVQPDSSLNPFVSSGSNGSTLQRSEILFACDEEESSFASRRKLLTENVTSRSNATCEQQSCTHSRSESLSSAISYDEKVYLLESTHPSSNKDVRMSSWFSLNELKVSENDSDIRVSSDSDDFTTESYINKLIEDLKSPSPQLKITAAAELRRLTKHNMENRVLITKCGAIAPLLALLTSKVKSIQENAVTALLNLSICNANKISIAEAGAIESLIHVLESGTTEAKENSAATLFSLSLLEEYKAKIGRSGAVKALVDLLSSGSLRGKKDAITALFNLSIFHENKVRIVRAGAAKYLAELMVDTDTGMTDKSVALLANLSTIHEGRVDIANEGGIPLLVETIESGTQRGKENAASALFQMCINSTKFCSLVLQEGVVPPLVALSQFGTPRAKEKAQQILSHFRSQREGSAFKSKQ